MRLIIHHWDADGVCSAAITAKVFEDAEVEWQSCTPPIGRFELDDRVLKLVGRAARIYFLDLNMVDAVKGMNKPIVFIDHHNQERIQKRNVIHVNPVLDGNSTPSASWVVSSYFSCWNHLSAIGAVGDLGMKLFSTEFGPLAEKLLIKHGISKSDALKIVNLIDSSYIMMDRKGVEESVAFLAFASPSELLEREEWIKNLERIENEIDKAFSNLKGKDIAWIEFSSHLNIISKVARRAVWEKKFNAAIVINKDFNGLAQLYIRLKEPSSRLLKLISELRAKGFNAGGKEEVVGVVCQKDRIDDLIKAVKEVFG